MASPPEIRILADEVVNKIAAGEVVERPASVVKELIENALDAEASHIAVDVVAGGRQSIVVSDNGVGMTPDGALLSIERHATSKIRDVHDIERISTLGFRGEALAAIAAVSRFTLTTRPHDSDEGTEITVAGGRLLDVKTVGCAPGTTVAVRNLFFNVPARRRFLRSEHTETAHSRQIFLLHALARTDVAWTLRVDELVQYELPAASTLEERIRAFFGPEFLEQLRGFEGEYDGVRVRGFAGLPQINRADRSDQYLFVNGRPASAAVIAYALQEAYGPLIPRGRHPVVFLFIDLPPQEVDVNVHPTKKEVRFRHASAVRDAIIEQIRAALNFASSVAPPTGKIAAMLAAAKASPAVRVVDMPELPAFPYPKIEPAPPTSPTEGARALDKTPSQAVASAPPAAPASYSPPPCTSAVDGPRSKGPWSWCRIIGQAGGLYVILETEDGLILMDPHAAHERVLFERFMRALAEKQVDRQRLLVPEPVRLSPEQAERVREHVDLLQAMGFDVSDFGGDTFVVDALPVFLGGVSPASVLGSIAATLERGGRRGGTERWAEEQMARAACKAAVKARDKLTVPEIEQLVQDLAACEMPYTCPHGRPTLIFLSFEELHRKFGRQ